VVLRLWRVFKIIEEFSSGAEDQLAELQERIEGLEKQKDDALKENEQLQMQLRLRLRGGDAADGHADGRA
jgi:regulator of replication initiation timing